MITMTALAEKAGVSRATVSHVLHERGDDLRISEATRLRVLEVAAHEGYRRNELFRSAVSGKSHMIGFLVHSARPEPVARILDGALEAAEKLGYTVKVLKTPAKHLERALIDRCIELRLAAVITLYLSTEELETLHRELAAYQIPLAVLDTHIALGWGVRVDADDAQSMRVAVEHLARLGHRNLGFVSGVPATALSIQREIAFEEAVKHFGLPRGTVVHGHLDAARSLDTARSLLRKTSRPSAVIGITDGIAMTVLRAARLGGLRVPEDLSVVGYGGMSLAEFSDPPLTTVVQPFEEIGRVAIRRLLERVHASADGFQEQLNETLLPSRLLERQTSGPAPTTNF